MKKYRIMKDGRGYFIQAKERYFLLFSKWCEIGYYRYFDCFVTYYYKTIEDAQEEIEKINEKKRVESIKPELAFEVELDAEGK
jgi:hypothetical protein